MAKHGLKVPANASIDWSIQEGVRAKRKVIVKRTLRQYAYPPDMQKIATETMLKQQNRLRVLTGAINRFNKKNNTMRKTTSLLLVLSGFIELITSIESRRSPQQLYKIIKPAAPH
ncbi:MAG: DUF3387 domain-containing protein [Candidatus Electrothrix sp. AR3]|nr:DUF3387 domain-containing protein [Candidatus Electrothrix sp. AR3]